MERRSGKSRTGHLPKGKLKHLTNLPFAFPVRNHQASSFGSTVNITTSQPESTTPTSDFHRTTLPRTATIEVHNSLVAQMSDRGTRALVAVKEGTGANIAQTPDTETKVEGMKIDSKLSDLSNDFTIQEFEFQKGNNYPSVKERLKENLIFWRKTLSVNSANLEIIDNGYQIPFFNPIQDGLFWGCSRMWGQKAPPSLKSVTHILQ